MARTNKNKQTKPAEEVVPVKEKGTKKKKAEPVPEPEPEVIDEVEVDDTVVEDTVEDETTIKKRVRRVITRDTILETFDTLLTELEQEMEAVRSEDTKSRKGGTKFFRSFSKKLRLLKNDSSRVMKVRKPTNRPKNTASGFMKPVQISTEMAGFTGWEVTAPRSRVDVTKYICNYIREKDLQNPSDRRIIVPDKQLKKLLDIKENESEPLTYYSLQKRIQHHFSNNTTTVS